MAVMLCHGLHAVADMNFIFLHARVACVFWFVEREIVRSLRITDHDKRFLFLYK